MTRIAKRVIVTVGLFSTLLTINPITSLPVKDSALSVNAAIIPGAEPKADQIGWVYRVHNGWLQRRRWNYTKGYWVDKYWINVKKV